MNPPILSTTDLDKKNLEEAASQHLVAIIESSDDAIISKSLTGTILSWNRGAQRIFGYTEDEVVGRHISILIPKDRQQEEPAILKRLIQGERIEHYETLRRRKDGELVPISLTVSPIRNAAGKIIGASKIARDITTRRHDEFIQKQAEEKLDQGRDQLRALIDNIPDYIYFKDTKSRFIDANRATVRVMKCKKFEELIGKTDFDFYPKEFAEKYFRDELAVINTGEPKIDIEENLLNENKETRIISTSKVPLKDRIGRVIGLVGIGRDITDRIRAQEVLARDNEALEKIIQYRAKELLEIQAEFEKAKRLSDIGTLAAIVAHELRNPLGVIKLAAHNLKKDKALADNKYIANINKKLLESERIIDNLLNYSRIKTPAYESCDLMGLVDECVSYFPGNSGEQQIIIEKKYDTQELCLEIDPYQIKEVLINIFNNACQALPGKNGKIEVSVRLIEDNHVCVGFKDNGVGIDEKDLNKIFTPFFTSKSRGTGLGLAICKELVNLHNGRIEVQSRKGEGTIFRVILPLRRQYAPSPI